MIIFVNMDMGYSIQQIINTSYNEEEALKQFYEWYSKDDGQREGYADYIRKHFGSLKDKGIAHKKRHSQKVIKSSKGKFPSNRIPPKKVRK